MPHLVQSERFINGWEQQLAAHEDVVASQALLMYYINDGEDLYYKIINHETDPSVKSKFFDVLEDLILGKVKNLSYAELNVNFFDSYEMEVPVVQFGWEVGSGFVNPSELNGEPVIKGWDLGSSIKALANN